MVVSMGWPPASRLPGTAPVSVRSTPVSSRPGATSRPGPARLPGSRRVRHHYGNRAEAAATDQRASHGAARTAPDVTFANVAARVSAGPREAAGVQRSVPHRRHGTDDTARHGMTRHGTGGGGGEGMERGVGQGRMEWNEKERYESTGKRHTVWHNTTRHDTTKQNMAPHGAAGRQVTAEHQPTPPPVSRASLGRTNCVATVTWLGHGGSCGKLDAHERCGSSGEIDRKPEGMAQYVHDTGIPTANLEQVIIGERDGLHPDTHTPGCGVTWRSEFYLHHHVLPGDFADILEAITVPF